MSQPIQDVYRPPSAALRSRRPVKLRGYRSPDTLALVASAFVGASAVAGLAGVVLSAAQMGEFAELASNIVEPLVTLAAGIVFFVWVHRIHSNIPAFGKNTDVTPSSAIIHYFIPFLNLVRPYQHMMAAWRLSTPKRSERDAPSPIGLWWGLWVSRGIISWLVGYVAASTYPLSEIQQDLNIAHAVLAITTVVAAVLCILMMLKLSERQDGAARRHKRRKRKRAKREADALHKMFGEAPESAQ